MPSMLKFKILSIRYLKKEVIEIFHFESPQKMVC